MSNNQLIFGADALARSNNSDAVLVREGSDEVLAYVDLWSDAAKVEDLVWSVMTPSGKQVFRHGSLMYVPMALVLERS